MPQKRSIRRPPEKPAANPARPKAKAKRRNLQENSFYAVLLESGRSRRRAALACAALCWTILNDSSNIMTDRADIVLGDFSGMTQDEVNASEQVASGQVVVNWEEEYNNDYAAGYVYEQSPVAGRTVREGQSVTLTVSLGIHYVTVPDLTNYVQADGEQQLKDLGVSVLVTQAVDESVAAGSIIRTDPAAGSQVAACTTVVIYVSRPQVATTTKVPSLIGMNVNDARTLLVPVRKLVAVKVLPDRAVQRPARGQHHQPEPRRGRIGQTEHPVTRRGQRMTREPARVPQRAGRRDHRQTDGSGGRLVLRALFGAHRNGSSSETSAPAHLRPPAAASHGLAWTSPGPS